MLTQEQLADFATQVFDALRRRVAERDPIKERVYSAKIVGGRAVIIDDAWLDEAAAKDKALVPQAVEMALAVPDVEAVCVCHEAWASKVPGAPGEALAHLSFAPDGRAEAIICALQGDGFQTGVIHAIVRRGKLREMVMGPMDFSGFTLGGAMARRMPDKH